MLVSSTCLGHFALWHPRSFGPGLNGNLWDGIWIYFVAPAIGVLLAAEIISWRRGKDAIHYAKLDPTSDVRCIFRCGYHPTGKTPQTPRVTEESVR